MVGFINEIFLSPKMEILFDLTDKFNENHRLASMKYAVFTAPVINGRIYLAQRNTPPQVGLYSLIGGKVDPLTQEDPKIDMPASPGSGYVGKKGFERLKWTSLRELIEELYNGGGKLTAEDIQSLDLTGFHIYDDETLLDANTGVKCYTKVVEVPKEFSLFGRRIKCEEFSPSKREIGEVRMACLINPWLINPLTKVALILMKSDSRYLKYTSQIMGIKNEIKEGFLGVVGDDFRFHSDYKSKAGNFQGFYFDYEIEGI